MSQPQRRILVVDDNPDIHEDFRKILIPPAASETLRRLEAALFEAPAPAADPGGFSLDSAHQGREALEMVRRARAAGAPYALAFVDIRMPPGWDGVETTSRLWEEDPELQVVICTAHTDYSWEEMVARLGHSDRWLLLRKPFDNVEVLQLAHALTRKWHLGQQARVTVDTLEAAVAERTRALSAANDALRSTEQRFSTAFQASPVAMAILRLDGCALIDVNPAFAQLVEAPREALLGLTPVEFGLCPEGPLGGSPCASLQAGQPLLGRPRSLRTRTGRCRDTLVSAQPMALSGVPHALLIVEDTSERMAIEQRLRQAQKMEAVGQLAAGIAHDFNNALQVILGHAAIELDTPNLNPRAVSAWLAVDSAATHAARLTQQLLAFGQRQTLQPGIVDLAELVREVDAMLRPLVGEAVDVQYAVSPELPAVTADSHGLEQVLLNLALNARDAMPEGGRLTIDVRAVDLDAAAAERLAGGRPGRFVRLQVIDTGRGMDAATQSRIFEPFFTTKPFGEGSGMGLAMVYGIVAQHGGWIEVESAVGSGSTFSVFLPAAGRVAAAGGPAGKARPAAAGGQTILAVEDNDQVLALISTVLRQRGYRVLTAGDGPSALEVWQGQAEQIDMLLTDLVMPGGMTGRDLAAKLTAQRAGLRVVYSSGYAAELSEQDLADGVAFVAKPYRLSELLRTVEDSFRSAPALRPPRDG